MYQRSSKVSREPRFANQSQSSGDLAIHATKGQKRVLQTFTDRNLIILVLATMLFLALAYVLLGTNLLVNGVAEDDIRPRVRAAKNQEVLGSGIDGERYKTACPDYKHYAVLPQYVLL